jgi:hypothetical protein
MRAIAFKDSINKNVVRVFQTRKIDEPEGSDYIDFAREKIPASARSKGHKK